MSEEKFYRCIPELNKECKKNNCYINGGECETTIYKKYTLKGLLEEIERLNKENTILRQNSQYLVKQKDELEEIINEALKFTKENENNISSIKDLENNKTYNSALLRVKDILQGVDKE